MQGNILLLLLLFSNNIRRRNILPFLNMGEYMISALVKIFDASLARIETTTATRRVDFSSTKARKLPLFKNIAITVVIWPKNNYVYNFKIKLITICYHLHSEVLIDHDSSMKLDWTKKIICLVSLSHCKNKLNWPSRRATQYIYSKFPKLFSGELIHLRSMEAIVLVRCLKIYDEQSQCGLASLSFDSTQI